MKVLPEVAHALAGARQDLYVGEEVRAVHAQLPAHAVGGILCLVVGEGLRPVLRAPGARAGGQ
eukprot:7488207-Alexandrium_andersonii.AAC.1